jgi:hypothetical protein
MAKTNSTTLYMVALTGLKTLLHVYTGDSRIIVGGPYAMRGLHATQKMLGCFAAVFPIVTEVSMDMTFEMLMAQVGGPLGPCALPAPDDQSTLWKSSRGSRHTWPLFWGEGFEGPPTSSVSVGWHQSPLPSPSPPCSRCWRCTQQAQEMLSVQQAQQAQHIYNVQQI